MELRSEESPDIQPYTHSRKVEKVVVSLGEDISKIKASYLKVLKKIVFFYQSVSLLAGTMTMCPLQKITVNRKSIECVLPEKFML